MQLTIDGEERTLIPIRDFRAQYGLPDDFSVEFFEPKDYMGLGHIDSTGTELNGICAAVVEAIPSRLTVQDLMVVMPRLGNLFREKLLAAIIQLRDVEIDYAVSGLDDVHQAVLFTLVRADVMDAQPPPFDAIYMSWLNNSVRVAQKIHSYQHRGEAWRIQILNTAYGRAGLVVTTQDGTHYVYDKGLSCPAEGFMYTLLKDVFSSIMAALTKTE